MRSPRLVPGRAAAVALLLTLLSAAPAALAGEGTWTTTFPFGGDVLSGGLVVSPADPRVLYALPESRALFRSEDGSDTWRNPVDDRDVPFDRVDAAWVDAGGEAGHVYLLGSTPYPDKRSAVFASRDGGRTWSRRTDDLPGTVTALTVVPGPPDRLLIGLSGGEIRESLDGGVTWRRLGVPAFTPEVLRLVVSPASPSTLYAALAPRGLHRSDDGGTTWLPVAGARGLGAVIDLWIDPLDPRLLLAVEYDPEPRLGCGSDSEALLRSFDAGATWSRFELDCTLSWDRRVPGRRLAVTADREVYATLMVDLWKGTLDGSSWQRQVLADDVEIRTVAVAQGGTESRVYAGTAAGVFRSTDGGSTWQAASTGMRAVPHRLQSHQIAFDASDPQVIYSGAWFGGRRSGGGFRSLDGGATWEAMELPNGGAAAFASHPARPGVVYAAHNDVARSLDRGATWERLAPTGPCLCFAFGDLRIDPFDPAVLYFAGTGSTERPDGVYRSADGGATWSAVGDGRLGRFVALGVDPVQPGVVYAGGEQPVPFLRLHEDRFQVAVWWRAPDGALGYGEPEPLTTDAGYFWFFREENVELLVKLLDGCPVNGRFWVFLAGLTNVEVRVQVSDRWTGAEREYANPQGEAFPPVQDTAALRSCAAGPADVEPPPFRHAIHRLQRSADGGLTWATLPVGPEPPLDAIRQVVVHPLDPRVIVLAADDVWRTSDGGATWRLVLGERNATAVALDPTDPRVIYVATFNGSGFHRSLDGGATWERFNEGLPRQPPMESLTVDPEDPRHVLAATRAGAWEIRLPPTFAGP